MGYKSALRPVWVNPLVTKVHRTEFASLAQGGLLWSTHDGSTEIVAVRVKFRSSQTGAWGICPYRIDRYRRLLDSWSWNSGRVRTGIADEFGRGNCNQSEPGNLLNLDVYSICQNLRKLTENAVSLRNRLFGSWIVISWTVVASYGAWSWFTKLHQCFTSFLWRSNQKQFWGARSGMWTRNL